LINKNLLLLCST